MACANDKLKFINLNYNDFKNLTPQEYPGIEEGYEIYDEMDDNNVSGNDADTAPESKPIIMKERRRICARKRRPIKRSQKVNSFQESEKNKLKYKNRRVSRLTVVSHSLKKQTRKTTTHTTPRKRPLEKEKSNYSYETRSRKKCSIRQDKNNELIIKSSDTVDSIKLETNDY